MTDVGFFLGIVSLGILLIFAVLWVMYNWEAFWWDR